MTNKERINSPQNTARLAGLLYLIYFVVEILADALGRSPLIVMGDAATTAGNLAAHEWLFRNGC